MVVTLLKVSASYPAIKVYHLWSLETGYQKEREALRISLKAILE